MSCVPHQRFTSYNVVFLLIFLFINDRFSTHALYEMIAKAILLFAGIVSAAALIGRTQSAGARGQLVCHGKPEAGVLIKMYDDDRGK
ncbi:hypothetical protein AB6A40_010852 [Gnathostoma spinigerum]|uniref:Uncharacterized protein n=1 Tax=Gnathostoma spinigerum TaxID=75299 RepID=A0ABD6EW23_9BILA